MIVRDWLTRNPGQLVIVDRDDEIARILQRLLDCPACRDVYVQDVGGRLIGHIPLRRLAHLILAEHRPEHTRRQLMERAFTLYAADAMQSEFAFARPDEELDEVLHRQLDHDVEQMPVLDAEDRPRGAIDLLEVLAAIDGGEL